MGISESKKKIVIDNYFKRECDVNTSIKEAFTKGFELGLKKAPIPQPKWIPINERLPEEHICADGYYVEPSDMVLITTVNGNVTVSRYWGNRYSKIIEEEEGRNPEYYDWIEAELWEDDVIAWMPLPSPYKGGEQNG